MAINVGSKYYKNTEDGRMVIRVLNHHDDICKCCDLSSGTIKEYKDSTINDEFIELTPDMKLDIMITEDHDKTKDVYVWVYRSDMIAAGSVEPIVMLRANVYSYFKNLSAQGNEVWVGDCLNHIDNPDQKSLIELAEFEKVIESQAVSFYITDDVNDIIACLRRKFKNHVDSVLNEMSNSFAKQLNIKGFSRTLEELMFSNNFIAETQMVFNIHKVPWKIILDEDSYDKNGDIVLNEKQIKAIEDVLRKSIIDVKVISYDKDVDISKIVQYEHFMISDETNKIYLIAYRTVSEYPVDDDIARGMGLAK